MRPRGSRRTPALSSLRDNPQRDAADWSDPLASDASGDADDHDFDQTDDDAEPAAQFRDFWARLDAPLPVHSALRPGDERAPNLGAPPRRHVVRPSLPPLSRGHASAAASGPRRSARETADDDDGFLSDHDSDEFPSLDRGPLPPPPHDYDRVPGRRPARGGASRTTREHGRSPANDGRRRHRELDAAEADDADAAAPEADDAAEGPQGPPRSRGGRRPRQPPAPPPDRAAVHGHGAPPARRRRQGSRRPDDPDDGQASNFVDRCFAWSLSLPQDNFIDALERVGAEAPRFLDPADLEERCAAVAWMNAFLDSGGDPDDWGSLPEHMRRTMLALYPVPRPVAGGAPASRWQRLTTAMAVARRMARKHPRSPIEIVSIPGSPTHGPSDPPPSGGAQINTSRNQAPLSRHPVALQRASGSSPAQQRQQPSASSPACQGKAYWESRVFVQPVHYAAYEDMPPSLWNVMDPRAKMELSKKTKILDGLLRPGLTNNQQNPAFIYNYSLDPNNGTPWESVARSQALAGAARSTQLDEHGRTILPEDDPDKFTDSNELLEHSDHWVHIPWPNTPITYEHVNQIKEVIHYIFYRSLQRSKLYHVDVIKENVQRICNESQTFFDSAIHIIAKAHKYEPAHLKMWKGNKDIYTLLYPFYTEHIMGQAAVEPVDLKAKVALVFAVPPTEAHAPPNPANFYAAVMAAQPPTVAPHALPAPAPLPPPPYQPQAMTMAGPRFLPPVPAFPVSTTMAPAAPSKA